MAHAHAAQHCFKLLTQHGHWGHPVHSEPEAANRMETVELLAAQQGDVEGAQGLGDAQEVAAPDWLSWWRVQCILHCSGAMRVRKPLSSGWQLAWFAAFMAPPRFWLVLIVTLVYVLPVRAPHLR